MTDSWCRTWTTVFSAALLLVCAVTPTCVVAQDDSAEVVRAALESAAQLLSEERPTEALTVLRDAETREPGNPWMWYYRGVAQLQLGEWRGSMRSFDRALEVLAAYGDPDPALAESIRRTRVLARRRILELSITMGLAYDSNVTYLGSAGETFDTISGRGDARFASRFSLSYSPIATTNETLSLHIRITDSWHFSIEEFDYQDYGATIEYDRRLDDCWRVGLRYDYDISYLGRQPFLSNHALTPSLTYRWAEADARFAPYETSLAYRIDARDFLFETDARLDRDGFANSVGFEQSFRLKSPGGDARIWDVVAGYNLAYVATEGSEFDRLLNTFYAGVGIPLPNPWNLDNDMTLSFSANVHIADYRNDSLYDHDRDERSDVITTLDMVLSQPIVEDLDLGRLTLNTIVSWSNADSNVTSRDYSQPFTYEKWIVGMQIEWSW